MDNVQLFGKTVRTRAARRAVVLATYGSFALGATASFVAAESPWKWVAALEVPPIIVCLLSCYALYQMTKGYAIPTCGSRSAMLVDERQARLLDWAMARSYLAVSFLLVITVLWLSMAADWNGLWRPVTFHEWNLVFWAVMLITSTLPQALLAWKLTDNPAGDDELGL